MHVGEAAGQIVKLTEKGEGEREVITRSLVNPSEETRDRICNCNNDGGIFDFKPHLANSIGNVQNLQSKLV